MADKQPMTIKENTLKAKLVFRTLGAKLLMMGGVALPVLSGLALAQSQPPVISQVIRSASPVYDQLGKICLGNELGREELGLDYVRGNRVEILAAPDGIIYPALIDGRNDPRNPLLHITYIGLGMDPEIETPGLFATSLTPRPSSGAKIFVRVYNMPSLELASFYSDSQLYTVSWSVDSVFNAVLPHTRNPIDPADDDSDGLNNSWERWKGSNPGRIDTDGDGFDDMSEFLAGTDADDWDSFLQIVDMTISNNIIQLHYMAGKGQIVHIQGGTNFMNFSQCSPVNVESNSPSGVTSVEISADLDGPVTVYRLGVPVNEF